MAAKQGPKDQGPRSFSGAQKAAIILIALGNELGARILQKLEPDDLKKVISGANGIGALERREIETLIQEFADRFSRISSLANDAGQVRSLLEAAFPGGALESLLGGPVALPREPVWVSFKAGSEQMLAPYLMDEHPQVAAYVLSRLDGGLAAKVLAQLPRELRAVVTQRLIRLQPATPPAIALVEEALRADLLGAKPMGQERAARQRVAGIVNEMAKPDADAMLADLAALNPDEARELKALLFAFEDIGALEPKAIATLFDKIATEQTIPALRGAAPELKAAVLGALGQRARRMVEAELARSDEPTPQGLAARRAIAQTALALAAEGAISLPKTDAAPA